MEMSKNERFEIIFNDYQKIVFKAAFSILHSKEDSEDVVIEVFLELYDYMINSKEIRNLKSWLILASKSTAIDYLRKFYKFDTSELLDVYPDGAFENASDMKMFTDEILEYLCRHHPRWYKILCMDLILGMSHREISKALEIPLSSVAVDLHRAKKMVTKKFGADATYFLEAVGLVFLLKQIIMDSFQ